ncbi:MAG: hypothetical protein Q8Q49_02500 [bacterium]|nr:hypothetical protein [bacterium]
MNNSGFLHHIKKIPLLLISSYVVLFVLVHGVLYRNIGAFGCFDDCPNIMAGWFLLKGKVLYSEIFYNHQPLIAFLSEFIQYVSSPKDIHQLILFHRLFGFFFSFCFGLLIVIRFRLKGFLFLLFYETTKYYFFGDRFLAEAYIVYPAVYLFGSLVTSYLEEKSLSRFDVFFGTVSSWLIIFFREPYIPLALVLYFILLIRAKGWRVRYVSLALFSILTVILYLQFPVQDYLFNVITVNQQFHLRNVFSGADFVQIVFYPFVIFFSGPDSPLRFFEMFLSSIFFASVLVGKKHGVSWKFLTVIVSVLALANFRFEEPGVPFYEAFHMLSWYALFLFSLFTLICFVRQKSRKFFTWSLGILSVGLAVFLLSPGSYLTEKVDSDGLFAEGYSEYYSTGALVNSLATPGETLFLDGWNDLIYWQAQRASQYKYSWYTSIMPGFERYTKAREDLLTNTPPDFFYGACKEWPFSKVTQAFLGQYVNVLYNRKPTCLYIKKSVSTRFPDAVLSQMREQGYEVGRISGVK